MKNMLTKVSPGGLRIVALIAVLILVIAFFSSQIENYLNGRLFNRITSSVAIMGLIAVAQTLVVITRNIDLSLGSVVGFTAFATGSLVAAVPEIPAIMVVFFAMSVGAILGAINGTVVAYLKVPSIIVTLATMALFRSALVELADGKSITSGNLPTWLTSFPNYKLLTVGGYDLRAGFFMTLMIVTIVWLILKYYRPARKLYTIGSNPDAAEMLGINIRRTTLIAFMCSGALAGLAGFMFLARFGNITVVAGLGFELKSVASSVVGGVNIFGGSGNVFGALIGSVLVDLIDTSLVRWQFVSEFWREAVLGGLILLSVTLDAVFIRRLLRMKSKE